LLANGFRQRALIFEAPAPLQDLLRGGLILPEIRSSRLGFDLRQFAREAGFVKAPSANRPRGSTGR
jgi:hypothetical protein